MADCWNLGNSLGSKTVYFSVIGEKKRERLARAFLAALSECFSEAVELIPLALVVLVFGLWAYLMGSMVYGLAVDPDTVSVAAKLDALSINPDKWIRPS